MSDWDAFNRPGWYDEKYFADLEGKEYRRADGAVERWGYRNPSGEMGAADLITRAWRRMFKPRTMLDVGTGRGTVVAYARRNRIEAYGFDFSEWALTEGLYRGCDPEWVRVHDATEPWPYPDGCFDLVTALDFYEHIYLENLPFVESEMRRVAREWCFLQVAISGSGGLQGDAPEGYVLHRGEPVPLELEANAVAGHVTVRPRAWWVDRFTRLGFEEDREMLRLFSKLVYPPMIRNWWLNAIIVLRKKP